MKEVLIPKGNGKFRRIVVQDAKAREHARRILRMHEPDINELDTADVWHGFTSGRNVVTNARQHIGWRYTLTMDLKDFFDSVTVDHVMKASNVPQRRSFVRRRMYQDRAAQGLTWSPAFANIAASLMDSEIVALGGRLRFRPFVYTRYADDMAFSFNHPEVGEMLVRRVREIAKSHGFEVNEEKTKLQFAGAGRRIITGVAVDDSRVHVTRETKRKIRAARHQVDNGVRRRNAARIMETRSKRVLGMLKSRNITMADIVRMRLRGLEEFAKLKLPKNPRIRQQARQQVQQANQLQGQSVSVTGPTLGRRFA